MATTIDTTYELRKIEDNDEDDSQNQEPQVIVVGGNKTNGVRQHLHTQQSSSATADSTSNVLNSSHRQILSAQIPIDKHKLVFYIFLLHGVGTLMPWNMFCTADDYFRQYKIVAPQNSSNDVIEEVNNIKEDWLSYLGLASQIPNLFFAGLNIMLEIKSGNLRFRINAALTTMLGVFVVTIALAAIDSEKWPVVFFYITLASVVVLNTAGGIYQNCIFGIAAKFPQIYTNAILIGSNLSGTFTSIVAIISVLIAPEPKTSAIYYFITALVVILSCIVTYNLLPSLSYFRYFDNKSDHTNIQHDNEENSSDSANGKMIATNDVPDNLRETVDAMVPKPKSDQTFGERLKKKLEVFNKSKMQLFNVYLTFFVTLSLFPSVLANITSLQQLLPSTYFSKVFCFFIFNTAALMGNTLSYYTSWPGKDRVWILTVARLLFIPFFLFCNFNPGHDAERKWPVLLPYDNAFIIGNFWMALTSGYLSSICMMFVFDGLKPEEYLNGGMLASFFLIFGISTGVFSTFLWTWVIQL